MRESTRLECGVFHADWVNSSIAPSASRVKTEPPRGAMAMSAVLDEEKVFSSALKAASWGLFSPNMMR